MKNFKKYLWAILGIFLFAALITLFTEAATVSHEIAGHSLVARLFGCDTTATADLYTGLCKFNCPEGTPTFVFALVALAGPLVAFFIGLGLWFGFGKDSLFRLASMPFWWYSTVPSFYPRLAGSDASYLIGIGFSPIIIWLIYGFIIGVVAWLITVEHQEKDPLGLNLFDN